MKQFTKVCLAVIALLGVMSSAVFAAAPGGYVGVGIGADKLDLGNYFAYYNSPTYNHPSSKIGVAGNVFAGYNFNNYLGLEAGLTHFGTTSFTVTNSEGTGKATYNLDAARLVAKAYLPVSENFNLYALGGVAAARSKVSFSSLTAIEEMSGNTIETKLRPTYGVGVSYDIPDSQFTTNLEWSRIQGFSNIQNTMYAIPTSDLVSWNISYKFD